MKLWPEPSSTVVSARRVVSAGTSKPLSRIAPSFDSSRDFRADAHRDAAVGEHDRREGEADAILLVLDRDRAERLRDRDRELAAGEEAGGFARKRGQVRLGEGRHQAVGFGEVERASDVEPEQLAGSAERGAAGQDLIDAGSRRAAADRSDGASARPWPMPNWKPLVGSLASRLTPICLSSERLTSAIRTCRVTCSGVAVSAG